MRIFSLRRNRLSKKGQGQSEYGLAMVLIGIMLVGTLYYFGTRNTESISRSADKIGGAGTSQGSEGGGSF